MRNKIVFCLALLLTSNSCSNKAISLNGTNNQNKNISEISSDKKDKIFDFAEKNDLRLVNKLLGEGSNINLALEGAVKGKHDELVDNLISRGANINDAIIKAEAEKLLLIKQNAEEAQISYYSKLIDRLLESNPHSDINYGKLISMIAIMKDNELLDKLLKNNNFMAWHLASAIMVDNHIAVKALLKDLRKDFCRVILDKDLGLMSDTDVVLASIGHKKGCFREFRKKGGAK